MLGGGWHGPAERLPLDSVAGAAAEKLELSAYDVRTTAERHSERVRLRLTATERDSLDLLVERWGGNRSQIVRSLIVGATLAELDRLDALDAVEPSFDDVLPFPGLEVK